MKIVVTVYDKLFAEKDIAECMQSDGCILEYVEGTWYRVSEV